MAYYQQTDILKEFQMKGSFKVEYAPYNIDHTTATWVEVGLCDNVSAVETATFLEGAAQNGSKPDINNGVASQTAAIAFEVWALDLINSIALRGGIDVLVTDAAAATAGNTTVYTGGGSEITPIMLRLTNRRDTKATAADLIQYTGTDYSALALGTPIFRDVAFVFFKCTITSGESITGKDDAGTDAALRFPYAFKAEEDTAREVKKQLKATERSITIQ